MDILARMAQRSEGKINEGFRFARLYENKRPIDWTNCNLYICFKIEINFHYTAILKI